MSVNKNRPHVFVLPEDDANRQLVNGFILELTRNVRQIQALPEAGGWLKALSCFDDDRDGHLASMRRNPYSLLVVLIDGDGQGGRFDQAKQRIPADLADRVFILGASTAPEGLKQHLGSYEEIGRALAQDCREGTDQTWGHSLLRHNAAEVARLREHVAPILF
jgi:hypothetical protein